MKAKEDEYEANARMRTTVYLRCFSTFSVSYIIRKYNIFLFLSSNEPSHIGTMSIVVFKFGKEQFPVSPICVRGGPYSHTWVQFHRQPDRFPLIRTSETFQDLQYAFYLSRRRPIGLPLQVDSVNISMALCDLG